MKDAAAGAEYATAGGPARPPAQSPDQFIEVSADFVPVDGLEFPADVRILDAVPDGSPSLLRVCLPKAEATSLMDDLLRLGCSVRKAAPSDPDDPATDDYYVRGPAEGMARLHTHGSITVSRDVGGDFALAAAQGILIEGGAQWHGDLEAGADIWMEAASLVAGTVRTPGVLTLEEGARVDGNLHVGRVRFLSDDPATVTRAKPPRPHRIRSEAQDLVHATLPAPPPVAPTPPAPAVTEAFVPVQAPDPGHFDWGSRFPGRYRIVARVKPAEAEIPKPFRAHLTQPGRLEVEVLEVTAGEVVVLLHPGTEVQRRLVCSPDEVRHDPVLWALLPILGRVTTLRMLYGDGTLGVRASADSIRWLITLFGKVLSLESRLGRLEQMRIFTEPGADPKESAFLMEPEAEKNV